MDKGIYCPHVTAEDIRPAQFGGALIPLAPEVTLHLCPSCALAVKGYMADQIISRAIENTNRPRITRKS